MHLFCTLNCQKREQPKLNGPFVAGGLQGREEGKNYTTVDIVFLILAGLIDRCTEWMKEAILTKVHVLYSNLMHEN